MCLVLVPVLHQVHCQVSLQVFSQVRCPQMFRLSHLSVFMERLLLQKVSQNPLLSPPNTVFFFIIICFLTNFHLFFVSIGSNDVRRALLGNSTNSTRRQRFLSTVTCLEVAIGKPKPFTFPPTHCLFFHHKLFLTNFHLFFVLIGATATSKAIAGISTNSGVTTEDIAKGKPKPSTFPPKHCLFFFIINYF